MRVLKSERIFMIRGNYTAIHANYTNMKISVE